MTDDMLASSLLELASFFSLLLVMGLHFSPLSRNYGGFKFDALDPKPTLGPSPKSIPYFAAVAVSLAGSAKKRKRIHSPALISLLSLEASLTTCTRPKKSGPSFSSAETGDRHQNSQASVSQRACLSTLPASATVTTTRRRLCAVRSTFELSRLFDC